MIHTTTWINLKKIMLNERNQILKCVHAELSHVHKTLGNANKSIVVESSDCLEMAGVGNEGLQKVIEETFGSDAYGPYLGSGDDCIVYTYVKIYQVVYFKYMWFIIRQL